MGVVIVGPSGAGKTSLYKLLKVGVKNSLFLIVFVNQRKKIKSIYSRTYQALFVLLLSTLVCYQPTELIWALFVSSIIQFYPPPPIQ